MSESMLENNMVNFSDNAINRVKSILKGEDNPSLKLRVFIEGGGCSGMQYGFTLDEAENDDDFVIDLDGVKALVDPASMQYLQGANIDFNNLVGPKFTLESINEGLTHLENAGANKPIIDFGDLN